MNSDSRIAVLRRMVDALETAKDGMPWSDIVNIEEYVREKVASAPSEEIDAVVDLIQHPPTPIEARAAALPNGIWPGILGTYLPGWLQARPDVFAPLTERLVRNPEVKEGILEAIWELGFYDAVHPLGLPDAYLPTLQSVIEKEAAHPGTLVGQDFSTVGSTLGCSRSIAALSILAELRKIAPQNSRIDIDQWIEKVAERSRPDVER